MASNKTVIYVVGAVAIIAVVHCYFRQKAGKGEVQSPAQQTLNKPGGSAYTGMDPIRYAWYRTTQYTLKT